MYPEMGRSDEIFFYVNYARRFFQRWFSFVIFVLCVQKMWQIRWQRWMFQRVLCYNCSTLTYFFCAFWLSGWTLFDACHLQHASSFSFFFSVVSNSSLRAWWQVYCYILYKDKRKFRAPAWKLFLREKVCKSLLRERKVMENDVVVVLKPTNSVGKSTHFFLNK